jgi:hypothetical protein
MYDCPTHLPLQQETKMNLYMGLRIKILGKKREFDWEISASISSFSFETWLRKILDKK